MRFASVLIVLWPLCLYAAQAPQGEISGSVDGPDGPIADVAVTASRGNVTRTTFTDAQGRYVFDSLEPGQYRLTASADALQASLDVLVASNAPLQITLTLTPAFAETSIVTASRDRESLLTTPAAVSVVGEKEIAASAEDGVPGLLQGVPGLNVTQIGGRDFNVNARDSAGRLSNSMLVMVDGRPLNQSFYGAVFWDLMTINKDEISQIEVVRTPASSLWGANALSGAINVRTKAPRELLGLRGYIGGGERGSATAGITWADAFDRVSYKLSGSYLQQDAWPRDNTLPDGSPMPITARFENRGIRQPKFDARVDWNANPDRLWSVRGGLAGANGLIHSALGPGEFAPGSYAAYLDASHQTSNYDMHVYWNRLYWPFRIVLFGLDETAANDTYAADATRRLTIGGRHHLTAGAGIKLDRFDIAVAAGQRQRVDGSGFVEDTIRVADRMTAVAGLRVDKFNTTSAVASPRLGIVFSPSAAHTVRASYNRAYRAPSLLENFANVALPSVLPLQQPFVYFQTALGSTDLAMESQNAFEVGYTGALNRRTTVFATAYDQTIARKIWFVPVAFYSPVNPAPGWPGGPATMPVVPSTFSFVNAGSVAERGLELAAQVDVMPVVARASFTFQATPTLSNNPTPFPLEINQPPRHRASAGAAYARNAWTLSSDVNYSGRAFWADVLTPEFFGYTPSFVNVDLRAQYRIPSRSWDVWFSATDALNRRIKAHVYGDTISRRVMAGLNWRYAGGH